GVEAHARIVAKDSYRRKLIQGASKVATQAWDNENPADLRASVYKELLSIPDPVETDKPVKMGWGKVFQAEEGVKVNIPVIDRHMRGLARGKLTTLAGPSGRGKSLLAGQIAKEAASQGAHTLIISMEMDDTEYEERMVRNVAQLDHPPMNAAEWDQVAEA